MSLRKAAEMALDTLEYAVRCAAMFECERAAEILRAALAESDEPMSEEPVLIVEREPGYWSRGHWYEGTRPYIPREAVLQFSIGTRLYTHPSRREPLTEEQIRNHLATAKSHEQTWLMFARAIERAHGIGGNHG